MNLEQYYSRSGKYFEQLDSRGFVTMPVLEFLKGIPFNEIAYAWVSTLRPSRLRVTKGEVTLDGVSWRVTVYIDDNNIIQEIEQEVEVSLPEEIENGHDLENKTRNL